MIDKKAIDGWLGNIDETKRKVLAAIAAIVVLCITVTTLLGGDIQEGVCGKPKYLCPDGKSIVTDPNVCPQPSTTTSTTSLPAVTTVPVTSIPTTSLLVATTLPSSYCTERSSGSYCDGIDAVDCSNGLEIERKSCLTVIKPIYGESGPTGKPSIELRPVPGVCHTNSDGASCCEEAICG